MSVCKNCGREIIWIYIEKRYIPVDPEPEFVITGCGYDCFFDEEQGEVVGRCARPDEVQTLEDKLNTPLAFVPHWRTCPCRK